MSALAKQHWEPTVKEYFEDHIPIEIIEKYKQIKEKAKLNGKAVTEKVTKKYIENFISTYNKNSKERLKKKDYFFFKGLEEKIRKDARLYSLKTSIEEYDYITSIKIYYYNLYTEYVKELTSNLQAAFNPYFTETEKSRLIHNSDFLDRTLLGTMYGNHELIEEIINDIKYPEIELTIEGKPIKFETEFDKNGKINRPVGNYSLSEVETKAYLKYNFDIDLKKWSEGKSKSSIINYIENYISDLKNKNLAINDPKCTLPIEEKLNTVFKNNLIIEVATEALDKNKKCQNIDNSVEDKLKVKQIALIHIYRQSTISRENADEIAFYAGYKNKKSGEGLFQDYSFFSKVSNRIEEPTPTSRVILKNKIELFESVLSHLNEEESVRAIKDIDILKRLLVKNYH